MLTLSETTCCPREQICDGCGSEGRLTVVPRVLPQGSLCLTVCDACRRDRAVPVWKDSAYAGLRIFRHRTHSAAVDVLPTPPGELRAEGRGARR